MVLSLIWPILIRPILKLPFSACACDFLLHGQWNILPAMEVKYPILCREIRNIIMPLEPKCDYLI